VALDGREAIPVLAKALQDPDPSLPFGIKRGKLEVKVVREAVRVNHLSNCLLCHAPSFNRGDLVRGAIPVPGRPLPAPATTPQYYESNQGSFVRADITFLRQDFSVMQTVPNPGAWPAYQRYDYMVRLRRATSAELQLAEKIKNEKTITPQREILRLAVQEVTGKDPGATPEEWKNLLAELRPVGRSAEESYAMTGKDWKQFIPVSMGAPDTARLDDSTRLSKDLVLATPEQRSKLLEKLRDTPGAEYSMALAEAIGQLNGEAKKEARDTLAERLSRFKPANVLGYMRHENLELRRAAALACALKDDKAQIGKLIELLEDPELSVQRAAFAALKDLTAQDFGPSREATEVERSRAIAAWKAWWKKQTGL
jgi:hypothetical protein